MSKKTIQEEINLFLESWDLRQTKEFFIDILPFLELYEMDDEEIGGDNENVRTIRLIRTVYLISRIAENHAGRLCIINSKFKNLWKRLEKEGIESND